MAEKADINVITPYNEERINALAKSVERLATIFGEMTRATKEQQKELNKQKKQEEEKIRLSGNLIKVGDKSIGQIKEEIAVRESSSKLWKENLKIARDANASEVVLSNIREKALKQNADLSTSSEEVMAAWGKFKSGKLNLSQFIKEADGAKGLFAVLGGSLTKMLGPVALLTGAVKAFDFMQQTKKDFASVAGIGNEYLSIGMSEAAKYKAREYATLGKMNVSGKTYQEDMTRFATMGMGSPSQSAGKYVEELQGITEQLEAVKTLFPGMTSAAIENLGYLLEKNLGVKVPQLANAFQSLKDKMTPGILTSGEFLNNLAEIAPELERFEGNVRGLNSALVEENKYQLLLKNHIISPQDIKKEGTSVMNAGFNQMAVALAFAKKSGIGIKESGILSTDTDIVAMHKLRMGMVGDKTLPYKLQEYAYQTTSPLRNLTKGSEAYYDTLYELIRTGAGGLNFAGTELTRTANLNDEQFKDMLNIGKTTGKRPGFGLKNLPSDTVTKTENAIRGNETLLEKGRSFLYKDVIGDFNEMVSDPQKYARDSFEKNKNVEPLMPGAKTFEDVIVSLIDGIKNLKGTLTIKGLEQTDVQAELNAEIIR